MKDQFTLYAGTGSSGKLREFHEFFNRRDIRVHGENIKLVEIQASTIEEVVTTKLASAYTLGGIDKNKPFFVDDSGLFIDALKGRHQGFPGVYSHQILDTIGMDGILKLMENQDNRRAHFECWIGLTYLGNPLYFNARSSGHISIKPEGINGFGFDPIFVPDGKKVTMAQLTAHEKELISHRGQALVKMYRALVNLGAVQEVHSQETP